jgi:mono/diheme cytochrome c family protein
MAEYIASLSTQSAASSIPPAPRDGNPVAGASPEIVAIYEGACANCHNDRNDVGPSKAISLSLSSSVRESGSANAVRVILQGIEPQSGSPGAYMPAFKTMLSDEDVGSLVQYVRERYTNQPQWTDIRQEISKAREGGS